MSNELYNQFLSSGFADLNTDNYQHIVDLYKHNYLEFLPKNKEAKILDIGCGMGQFLTFIGQQGYGNYLGIDISKQAIDFCLDRGITKVQKIDDLRAFLQSAEMYDLIVLNDVIEHLPKDEILPILKLINQKLNQGGSTIIKTGNLSSIVGPRIRFQDFTHEVGFTEHSLSQVLKVVGFQEIKIEGFVFPKNKITRMLRFIAQQFTHAFWRLTYFIEFTQVPQNVDELIFAVAKK